MTTLAENIFFTSDNHFGHKGILNFCPKTREGSNTDEMDEIMIERWNAVIKDTSTVYCLGDFTFHRDPDKIVAILERLKGKIHLITGNHCQFIKKWKDLFTPYFESVQDYKEIQIDGINVYLFHYPIQEWRNAQRGSFHLFGHVHGDLPNQPFRSMDVGIDTRPGMTPYTWKEIHALLINKPTQPHHGKTIL